MKVDIFNTTNKYSIIYADPPWSYNDSGVPGGQSNIIQQCPLKI